MSSHFIHGLAFHEQMLGWWGHRLWRFTGLALLALPCLTLLFTYDPAVQNLFPPCPFRALTGLDCPGCGTLRGVHQLLRGNPQVAMDLNPMLVVILPVLGCAILYRFALEVTGRTVPDFLLPAPWIWGLLGMIIVFWTARNIPVYPLTFLAS